MISTTKNNMFDFILSIWNITLSTLIANEYLTLVLIFFTILLNVLKIYNIIKDILKKKNENDK